LSCLLILHWGCFGGLLVVASSFGSIEFVFKVLSYSTFSIESTLLMSPSYLSIIFPDVFFFVSPISLIRLYKLHIFSYDDHSCSRIIEYVHTWYSSYPTSFLTKHSKVPYWRFKTTLRCIIQIHKITTKNSDNFL